MKPRRTQTNGPELVRSDMAAMFLIFAFVFRREGAEIVSVIMFAISICGRLPRSYTERGVPGFASLLT